MRCVTVLKLKLKNGDFMKANIKKLFLLALMVVCAGLFTIPEASAQGHKHHSSKSYKKGYKHGYNKARKDARKHHKHAQRRAKHHKHDRHCGGHHDNCSVVYRPKHHSTPMPPAPPMPRHR
jgi:hypothetical protein